MISIPNQFIMKKLDFYIFSHVSSEQLSSFVVYLVSEIDWKVIH